MEQGYKWLPYKVVNVATSINGEIVWYKNKWKNFALKIKHLFAKPKYLKNAQHYSNKKINAKFYGKIKISGNNTP